MDLDVIRRVSDLQLLEFLYSPHNTFVSNGSNSNITTDPGTNKQRKKM